MTAELLSKREDEAGENYVGKPGRTWETVSGNHWITESFKLKAAKWPSPDAGTPAITPCWEMLCQPQAQQDHIPPAHHTCSLHHVAPTRAIWTTSHLYTLCLHLRSKLHPAPAIQTTRSPYTGCLRLQSGPAPTCVLHRRTCNPDFIPPIHRAVASATRTGSHPRCVPPKRQQERRPSDAPHLQPKPGPTYTSLLLSRLHPRCAQPSFPAASSRPPSYGPESSFLRVHPPRLTGRDRGTGGTGAQRGCSPGRGD